MQRVPHAQKWRETQDVFALQYVNFHPLEVLSYPYARNDVFLVEGSANGKQITAYVKIARQKDSDIQNEVNILQQLNGDIFPKVLDTDGKTFCVTQELFGLRLSNLAAQGSVANHMQKYGETLARIHQMKIDAERQKDRVFFHRPSKELLKENDLLWLDEFFQNKPQEDTVFCHGDFHYANVLWLDENVSGVLDFELAGYGDRNFDIAWALFVRSGQNFLRSDEEISRFLSGYRKLCPCNEKAVKFYVAQCYVHFLRSYETDDRNFAIEWLNKNCR